MSYRDLFRLIEVNDYDILWIILSICHDIYDADRVIIVGGLFPTSIAVEFQTDLITLGKMWFNIMLMIQILNLMKMIL